MSEAKKTGKLSIEETLQKVNRLASRLAALESLYEELEAFVSHLSLSDFINAREVLLANDHAAIAGLVSHFMDHATSMYMGDD